MSGPEAAIAEDPWAMLAARVHAGRVDAVAAELDEQCGRGSGAACSALADLMRLGVVLEGELGRARALYLRACGRGHAPACRTLEQRVTWLTLPLLRPRHLDPPGIHHAAEAIGPDEVAVDVCVDRDGTPGRVNLRGSTGRDAEDERIVRAVNAWQFEPIAAAPVRTLVACDRFVIGIR